MSDYPNHSAFPTKPPTRAQRIVSFLSTHPSRRRGLNWTIWVVAALVAISVATGQSDPPRNTAAPAALSSAPSSTASDPAAPAAATVTPAPTPRSPSSTAQPRPVVPQDRQHAGDTLTAAGVALPNHARTPGARNFRVTQATISSTICVVGYTTTIRPPSSYTGALKIRQLATGYTYRGDTNPSNYQEDHLISLELGGSPTSAANLWPQPYASTEGARIKDTLENKLHALVCARRISLATAQHAVGGNWWTAYQHYSSISTTPTRTTPRPVAPAPHTHPYRRPAPPVAPGGGATAKCNDGSYSYAAHHQGACSHHGGVAVFYK